MNTRFLLRSALLSLVLIALILAAISLLPPPLLLRLLTLWSTRPPDPTPLPPLITAPRGELPQGMVGLTEYVERQDADYSPVGSGFILRRPNGETVGVTTAHSVSDLGARGHTIVSMGLALPGQQGKPTLVFRSETLYGEPGVPRTGDDLTVDWVLLKIDSSETIDPALVLAPDPRGGPQPGERVSMFSGLGDGAGGRRELPGTVQSAEAKGVWVLMDDYFDPGMMSGSPLLSQHTGLVVGMAIALQPRGSRLLIGFHPIGSIAQRAEAANAFPELADFHH